MTVHEQYRLRPHVYVLRREETGTVVVASGQQVEDLGPDEEWKHRLLRTLASGAHRDDELTDGPGPAAPVARLLARLRAGGWIETVVVADGVARWSVVPNAAPPDRPDPPSGSAVERLSRLVVMRAENAQMVLELPHGWADLRIADPACLAMVLEAEADGPEQSPDGGTKSLLRERLLDDLRWTGLRVPDGGPDELRHRQWSPHEIWMHHRTRTGFGAYLGSGFGATRWAEGRFDPPAVRHPVRGDGELIALHTPDLAAVAASDPPFTEVLEGRHSDREHDDDDPITVEEIGEFLFRTFRTRRAFTYGGVEYLSRPYPSGGSVYELDAYLVVRKATGLDPGLYFYDGRRHGLCPVEGAEPELRRLTRYASLAARIRTQPQVLVLLSARFGRVMWTYENMGYPLILKNVGTAYQTMYLVATAMNLAACGLGSGDGAAFGRATGVDPLEEGTVGEFMLGRGRAAVAP